MDRRLFLSAAALVVCGTGFEFMTPPPPPPFQPKVTGPYTVENLSLFLIHGPDEVKGRKFVTLKEAMEQKIIVVHETSNVNLLSVENTSTTVEVFIMAGDVVKGGKQDRAIAFDLVVPPKSGATPLPSFCVESGRWRKRGGENEAAFHCSEYQIVGKGLKNALNRDAQQGEVWKEVAVAQQRISENVGKPVQNAASPTSLQLALEDKDVKEKLAKYETPLAGILKDKKDVIGVVAVVNGSVSGADAFGSGALFETLWPKLLKSACTEALAEYKADKKFSVAKVEEVEAFLAAAAKGEAKEVTVAAVVPVGNNRNQTLNRGAQQQTEVNAQVRETNTAVPVAPPMADASKVRILKFTNAKSLLIESREKDNPTCVLHRCYIAK